METTNTAGADNRLTRVIKLFERGVVVSLVVMMMLVVALAALEFGWMIVQDVITRRSCCWRSMSCSRSSDSFCSS